MKPEYPMGRYNEFLSVLRQTKNIGALKNGILKIVNQMGFSDFIFMRLDRHWVRNSSYGLLYSVPEELMRIYHEEKMYVYDFLISSAIQKNANPQFSSSIYRYINEAPYEIEFINKNRSIQQLNRRFTYFDHYAVPKAAYNTRGSVQLIITHRSATPDQFQSQIRHCVSDINSLCTAIDVISTKVFYQSFINYEDNPAKISSRQLSVLSILANNDLTISEVANQMNISPITAHQHLAAARQTLGVATNIAAIKRLVMLGCIEYAE